ncbi:hypothetical protein BLA50215_00835 [Burkholderia lata]|uniref:hypothetical protein n=1 Tax=Burkholderia lata (strain ATCC 17760 / DSM 23089 / LMG 22485 / NCIMB 9086 / R18194 / 383) TaxID=482957 RepID=UPI0014547357|nr:hypothetical protein [Burkholderia lata]VWC74859.1 hypothetical protein BLA50215_00835 [Burkholderia lata]
MTQEKPKLQLSVSALTGDGFPSTNDEVFRTMLQQAASGGAGTDFYLSHVQKFADFAVYLQRAGSAAYRYEDGPKGSKQASATDGQTTISINVRLAGQSDARLYEMAQDERPPVHGIATVKLQLPSPESIDRIVNLAISLAEIPPGLTAGQALIDALFKPIVDKLTQFVQTCLDNWAELELGEDLDAAGDAIADGASDAAEVVGEEAAEIAVDEVAAEAFIDLAAAAPPLAVLGALVAIPFIVGALEKKFILHFEVDNFTDYDLEWKIEYMDEGTMTSQPQSDTVPKLGYATDVWGDQTTVQVAYQANYSSMNTSGFSGIGLLLHLTPKGAPAGSDVAAVISIPWIEDNVVWLGDVPANPNWSAIYDRASSASSQLAVEHGNLKFFIRLAINALSGNHDQYYCVLTIEPL